MFVSKNRTLLLIALVAMINCADSFGGESEAMGARGEITPTGWYDWFYNQLPSRSSLGYYGGSALSGVSPYALGYYTPIIERPSYALTKAASMIGSPVASQSLLDAYYQPTLAQQRRAQLARALTGALVAGAFSQYAPYSADWRTKLLLMGTGAALSGGLPSFYPSRENLEAAVVAREAARRSEEIDQYLEREAQESYQAPDNQDFIDKLKDTKQLQGYSVGDEAYDQITKLGRIFGYENAARDLIKNIKRRAAEKESLFN